MLKIFSVKKISRIFFVLTIVVVFLFGAFLYSETSFLPEMARPGVISVSPTPFPFRELTIPYLRERAYKSSLGSLEMAYENDSYTAYVTEYDSDGLSIGGLLTIPKGAQPPLGWGAIVFVHGYIPPSQYQTLGAAYSTYVDYLARGGFVVFKIDLRGHGNSDGESGGAYYSSDYIIDTLNARSALASTSFVNSQKIGLWGHSMAGNVVMRSLAAMPDIPAAVIWSGAVYTYEDMREYGISDASYRPPANLTQRIGKRNELYEKYGTPSAKTEFWREVAPASYLSELRGAVQIHHALDDAVVNIGYSRDLNILLGKTVAQHEFYEYSSGGHNITGASFTLAMERTVEFFKQYL